MASAFAVPLILIFVLTTSTCDGVRLANYIPTLQEYPAGRDDLIEATFTLGWNIQRFCCFLYSVMEST